MNKPLMIHIYIYIVYTSDIVFTISLLITILYSTDLQHQTLPGELSPGGDGGQSAPGPRCHGVGSRGFYHRQMVGKHHI